MEATGCGIDEDGATPSAFACGPATDLSSEVNPEKSCCSGQFLL